MVLEDILLLVGVLEKQRRSDGCGASETKTAEERIINENEKCFVAIYHKYTMHVIMGSFAVIICGQSCMTQVNLKLLIYFVNIDEN